MTTDPSLPRFEIHRAYHGARVYDRFGRLDDAVVCARTLEALGTWAEVRDGRTGERLWPEMEDGR